MKYELETSTRLELKWLIWKTLRFLRESSEKKSHELYFEKTLHSQIVSLEQKSYLRSHS
jgi:hypothetical protein